MKQAALADNRLEELAGLFRLLSDPTRLNLLMLLVEGEQNVTALCESLKLPQPTISHHLGLMRISKVLSHRRVGKQIFYSLNRQVSLTSGDAIEINTGSFGVRIASRPDESMTG